MNITSAALFRSVYSADAIPDLNLPHVCFIGRSNVGKSTLINTLLQRKIALTSSKPGRTRCLNFYLINNELFFVDFPGYGFSYVSKEEKRRWKRLVENYLSIRRIRIIAVLIFDIRRKPDQNEIEMIRWMRDEDIPLILVLTKADKISKNNLDLQQIMYEKLTGINREDIIIFSALNKMGKEKIWRKIKEAVYLKNKERS